MNSNAVPGRGRLALVSDPPYGSTRVHARLDACVRLCDFEHGRYLRTPNSKHMDKELPPVQARSQSTSPTKFTVHPSYHPVERASYPLPCPLEVHVRKQL
jgi:hypothetical protein